MASGLARNCLRLPTVDPVLRGKLLFRRGKPPSPWCDRRDLYNADVAAGAGQINAKAARFLWRTFAEYRKSNLDAETLIGLATAR
jgi:hypothetical protein